MAKIEMDKDLLVAVGRVLAAKESYGVWREGLEIYTFLAELEKQLVDEDEPEIRPPTPPPQMQQPIPPQMPPQSRRGRPIKEVQGPPMPPPLPPYGYQNPQPMPHPMQQQPPIRYPPQGRQPQMSQVPENPDEMPEGADFDEQEF